MSSNEMMLAGMEARVVFCLGGGGGREGEGLLYAAYLILAGWLRRLQKNLQCRCAQMVRTAENTYIHHITCRNI